jgi:hypothetical protein
MTNRHVASVGVAIVFLVLAAGSGDDKSESKKTPTAPTATPPPAAKAPTADEWWATRSQEIATLLKEAADARKKGDVDAIQPKLADTVDQLQKARQTYPTLDAQISDAISRLAAEQKAVDTQRKAEEKKRLAARQFIWLQPEGLAQQLAARNDPDELWGTQYQGKFVRWAAKYERSGVIVKFVASTGDFTSLSCKDFDPAHDPVKFDDVGQWNRISVEGKLDTFKKQMGKDKVEFMLTECIARKL